MSKFSVIAVLAIMAMTVSAEEKKKTFGQMFCNYLSRFPGCGGSAPAEATLLEEGDSLQAINCMQYPDTPFCQQEIAKWTPEEQELFWSRYRTQRPRTHDEDDSVQAINCMQYPNTQWCKQEIAKWSPEDQKLFWARVNQKQQPLDEPQAMLGGAINCVQYVNDPRCVEMRKRWDEEREEMLGFGNDFVSGVFAEEENHIQQKLQRGRKWASDKAAPAFRKTAEKIASLFDEEEQGMMGAINCQAYPNAPFCVQARRQWEAEAQADQAQAMMGAINCQAYPNAPFCVQARAQWEAEEQQLHTKPMRQPLISSWDEEAPVPRRGLVNCSKFPNAPVCAFPTRR